MSSGATYAPNPEPARPTQPGSAVLKPGQPLAQPAMSTPAREATIYFYRQRRFEGAAFKPSFCPNARGRRAAKIGDGCLVYRAKYHHHPEMLDQLVLEYISSIPPATYELFGNKEFVSAPHETTQPFIYHE
jgi:hypothetical protein